MLNKLKTELACSWLMKYATSILSILLFLTVKSDVSAQSLESFEERFAQLPLVEVVGKECVVKDIQLTDPQVEALSSRYFERAPRNRKEKYEFDESISEVLDSNQLLRLRQLRLQASMKLAASPDFGFHEIRVLNNAGTNVVVERLGSYAKEIDELRASILIELKEERVSFIESLMTSLTGDQRAQYNKLFGNIVVSERDLSVWFQYVGGKSNILASADPRFWDWNSEILVNGQSRNLSQKNPVYEERNLASTLDKPWVRKELQLGDEHLAAWEIVRQSIQEANKNVILFGDSGDSYIVPDGEQEFRELSLDMLPFEQKLKSRLMQIHMQQCCRVATDSTGGLRRVASLVGLSERQERSLWETAQKNESDLVLIVERGLRELVQLRERQYVEFLDSLDTDNQHLYDNCFGDLLVELSF